MNREKWAEMVGDDHKVIDDLRWRLFQAEWCMERIQHDETFDKEKYDEFMATRDQAKIALAALWRIA